MARAVVSLTLVAMICVMVPVVAQAAFLSGPEAKSYSKRAVKQHPKMGYVNGFEKKINCEKVSRIRKRCAMQWDVGPALIKGHSTITERRSGSGATYQLDFKAFDRNCECTYDYPNWRGSLDRRQGHAQLASSGRVRKSGVHKCHGHVGDDLGGWKRIRAVGLNCPKAKRHLESFLHTTDLHGWAESFNGPREVFTKNEKRISGIPLGD